LFHGRRGQKRMENRESKKEIDENNPIAIERERGNTAK
jgi:hypothetical protein